MSEASKDTKLSARQHKDLCLVINSVGLNIYNSVVILSLAIVFSTLLHICFG